MTPEEFGALNRAIARLLDRWQASDDAGARILALEPHKYRALKRGDPLKVDDDVKLRMILLLNIHVQLGAFFADRGRRYRWMNQPNAAFGQSPLDMLASGDLDAILRVQAYLCAEIEGGF